ncbi:MAG TPA: ATP-binding protein, partial [Gemmatimonadales bacterium]|nr:ATP-binding protein [Gemmatimonadales bacterium]
SRFWGSGMMIPLLDDAGHRFGLAKILRDLTSHRRHQQLQSGQRQILEQIARGAPISEVVAAVVDLLQSQVPRAVAMIRVADAADGGRDENPQTLVGPTTPGGAEPGTPRSVTPRREWSTPICAVDGEQLGVLITTYDEDTIPSLPEQEIIDVAVQLVATAIGKHRLQAALTAEQAREQAALARAFELSPTFLAVLTGPEHTFTLTNPAYDQLIGHRPVLGKPASEALPEIEGQGFFELLDQVYQSGEPFVGREILVRVQRTAGAEPAPRYLDFVYQPFRGRDGRIEGIVVSGVDTTDAVRARERVEQLADARDRERRQLETVLTQSPVAIVIAEAPSGRILFMNEKFTEIMGHATMVDALSEYSRHYIAWHLDGRPVVSDEWPMSRALRHGEIVEGETLEIQQPGGRRRLVTFNAAPVRNAAGEVAAGITLFWDVTEQRSAEQQLRNAERMQAVGTLAGGMAHEVNNQMTAVLGFGEFVLRALGPAHPQAADMRLVLQAADRAARVSQQLLTFTRQQVTQPRRLDLVEVLSRLAPVLRQLLGADKELVLSTDPAVRPISADPGQVEQVLINLVANARDATDTGDTVTIQLANAVLDATQYTDSAEEAGLYVCMSVADSGHGMDRETRARIFDPFFTTKPVGQGTGLGLSLVYGVVTKHGGRLKVTSEPGQGTTISIYWPVARAESGADAGAAAAGTSTEDARSVHWGSVLVVEDEPIIRLLAERTLEDAGFEVLGAPDGQAALQLLDDLPAPPSLIITDAIMPRMNGRQLAEVVAERYQGVPVLFMSGYTGEDVVRRRLVPEGAPYLQKPFTPDQLERAVWDLLPGRGD